MKEPKFIHDPKWNARLDVCMRLLVAGVALMYIGLFVWIVNQIK